MHINSRFQHIYRNVSYRSNFERSYLGLNQFLPPNVLVLVEKKTLGQALKTFRTSSKALLLLPSFSLKSLVVLIKKFFKGLLLNLMNFFFIGAYLWSNQMQVF